MSGFVRPSLLARCFVVLVFGVNGVVADQVIASSEPTTDQPVTATMQLEDVRLKGDIAALLAQLALQCDIPIGFEHAMNAADISERRMKFEKITLSDLLAQVVSEYKQYSWEIRDGVVYVFPKEGFRDPIVERLLSVKIKTFSVKKGMLTGAAVDALLNTSEFQEVMDSYGLSTPNGYVLSGFYFPQLGRNFTLDASDTTVMSILYRIVKESPVAKFWSISRCSSSHRLLMDLAANHEGTPKNLRRPVDFEELERLSYPLP